MPVSCKRAILAPTRTRSQRSLRLPTPHQELFAPSSLRDLRAIGASALSTHTAAALYATFPPAEARRVLKRLEFHFTPKHASWLNMVEIEIGVLKG